MVFFCARPHAPQRCSSAAPVRAPLHQHWCYIGVSSHVVAFFCGQKKIYVCMIASADQQLSAASCSHLQKIQSQKKTCSSVCAIHSSAPLIGFAIKYQRKNTKAKKKLYCLNTVLCRTYPRTACAHTCSQGRMNHARSSEIMDPGA